MKHTTWMGIAKLVANAESKCISQKVGAVLVKNNKLMTVAYNGTPAGQPNCNDVNRWMVGVNGFQDWVSPDARNAHHEWSLKHEIHAEMNAILHTSPEQRAGAILYCTLEPCVTCSILLSGSGISAVVYDKNYDKTPPEALERLTLAGIKVYQLVHEDLVSKN